MGPTDRLVFVLHDMFAIPFDEIAPHLGTDFTVRRRKPIFSCVSQSAEGHKVGFLPATSYGNLVAYSIKLEKPSRPLTLKFRFGLPVPFETARRRGPDFGASNETAPNERAGWVSMLGERARAARSDGGNGEGFTWRYGAMGSWRERTAHHQRLALRRAGGLLQSREIFAGSVARTKICVHNLLPATLHVSFPSGGVPVSYPAWLDDFAFSGPGTRESVHKSRWIPQAPCRGY
jgi:hypothetical protein